MQIDQLVNGKYGVVTGNSCEDTRERWGVIGKWELGDKPGRRRKCGLSFGSWEFYIRCAQAPNLRQVIRTYAEV